MTEIQQKRTLGVAIASLVFGCLFIIPFLGPIFSLTALILGIIALVKISKNRDTLKGNGLAIAGIVLGGIGVIIIPIIALLAAIAIPNFLRARVNANEAQAAANVKTISVAIESYKAAQGDYPEDEYDLVSAQPPYLPNSYNNQTKQGYNYSLEFSPRGYKIKAEPSACGTTGLRVFSLENGATLQEKDCK